MSSLPSVQIDTKFMNDYRVASPVTISGNMIGVTNSNGAVECFTVASNKSIWNFYPDASSDTGYNSTLTGLIGTLLAGGRDNSGHLVIFTANGAKLQYAYEINQGTSRWSDIQTVTFNNDITGILTKEIGGQLYVQVIFDTSSIYWSQFTVNSPTFTEASMIGSSLDVWGLDYDGEVTIVEFRASETIAYYHVLTNEAIISVDCINPPMPIRSIDGAITSNKQSLIFPIGSDGNLYQMAIADEQPKSTQLGKIGTLVKAHVVSDTTGGIHVFCLSNDQCLYHWTTTYSEPLLIQKQITNFCTVSDGNNANLFLIENGTNNLLFMDYEDESKNWTVKKLEVLSDGAIEEYISYSTDVTLYDPNGALLTNEPVTISTAEETIISINGSTYLVSPSKPITTTTNIVAKLSIAQETTALSIPAISINVPSCMSSNESIVIAQNADVQNALATASGNSIMNATDSKGNYLLPENYRTETNADSIATACNNCMRLITTKDSPNDFCRIRLRNPNIRGVWMHSDESIGNLIYLQKSPIQKNWQLSFTNKNVLYQELTDYESEKIINESILNYKSANGVFDWLSDIGDFFDEVVNDIVSITNIIIKSTKQGFQAVITFVFDKCTYVFTALVNLIEQAFDIVQTIWAQVEVGFNKLFEWLGFIFDWNDILRTHQALVHAINQMPEFLSSSLSNIQTLIDNGIENLQDQVANIFQDFINNFNQTQSIGNYLSSNQPQSAPVLNTYLSNNIIANNFLNNIDNVTSLNQETTLNISDIFDSFISVLRNFQADVQTTNAFAAAEEYFSTISNSPDTLLQNTVSGLICCVEGVIQAGLAGCRAVVDALFIAIKGIILSLTDFLNTVWNVPFVSQFYKWLTNGSDLCAVDLFALIIAIPATIIYKASFQASPFPDDTSVNTFKSQFTYTTMLEALGFLSDKKSKTIGSCLPVAKQAFLSICSNIGTIFYGLFAALCDSKVPLNIPPALCKATIMAELSAQLLGFPYNNATDCGVNCTTPGGIQNVLWFYNCIGISLDWLFLLGSNSLPENSSDLGVLVAIFFALWQLILTLDYIQLGGKDKLTIAANITYFVPGLCKFLLFTPIVASSRNLSPKICAIIDGVLYTASGLIGIGSAIDSIMPHTPFDGQCKPVAN